MTAPANTFTTLSAIGIRESLHNIISILNKDECPFQAAIGAGTAENTYEEWQQDVLGNAGTNANLEGDDSSAASITPTVRVGNRCQILKKVYFVSNTEEVVKKAGRDSEISYQTALFGRRIKMDLEKALLGNTASNAETAGVTARNLGGAETWYATNVSRGSGGSNGGFSSNNTVAPTDGTQRTSTEALLKTVIKSAWLQGGRPSLLLMGGTEKQNFSGFTGIATQFQEPKGKMATLVGAADRYVSDFGTFTAVADRFTRGREIHVLDPALWRVLWLRKWKKEELAKTGDARKFHIVGEATLEARNEAGNGIVADLL